MRFNLVGPPTYERAGRECLKVEHSSDWCPPFQKSIRPTGFCACSAVI